MHEDPKPVSKGHPRHRSRSARWSQTLWPYLVLLTAAVAGAATWFIGDLGANDLWWHLAAGREFFTSGQVPRVDPFSFTFEGRPWMNHEWLWGVGAYALYRVSPAYLAAANFALLGLTFALTFHNARRASDSGVAAVLACWLAASCTYFFSDIRPHVVTLSFSVLLLATRQTRFAAWLWPPLIALWCNLHAGYVFGLGMIALRILTQRLQQTPRLSWLVLLSCLAASAANPWGYRLIEFAFRYAPGAARSLYASEINDFQPLGFDLGELSFFGPVGFLTTFRGRFAVVLVLAALGATHLARRDPFLVLLGITSACMAVRAQRFVELAALLLAPLVAAEVAQLLAAVGKRAYGIVRLSGLFVVIAAAALWTDTRLGPDPFGRWTQPNLGPHAAVRYLRAIDRPLRVFNLETWGGVISLDAPQHRVFFDGRADTVYDEALYRDYLSMVTAKPTLPALLDKYHPEAVLLPHIRAATALRELPEPWVVAYEDQLAVLLVPPHSPLLAPGALPNPDVVLAREPQWLRRKAVFAYVSGDADVALQWLHSALVIDPLYLVGYGELMNMVAQRGGTAAAAEVANTARTQLPEQRRAVLRQLGSVYEQYGDAQRAAALYRSAMVAGPFDNQLALRTRVRELEAAR